MSIGGDAERQVNVNEYFADHHPSGSSASSASAPDSSAPNWTSGRSGDATSPPSCAPASTPTCPAPPASGPGVAAVRPPHRRIRPGHRGSAEPMPDGRSAGPHRRRRPRRVHASSIDGLLVAAPGPGQPGPGTDRAARAARHHGGAAGRRGRQPPRTPSTSTGCGRELNTPLRRLRRTLGPINRITYRRTGRVDEITGEDRLARIAPPKAASGLDPHSPAVYALEDFDATTGTARKAPIMSGRVVAPRTPRLGADTPADAVAICLDTHGEVRLDEVARLLGRSEDDTRTRADRAGVRRPRQSPSGLIPAAGVPVRQRAGQARRRRDRRRPRRRRPATAAAAGTANIAALRAGPAGGSDPGRDRRPPRRVLDRRRRRAAVPARDARRPQRARRAPRRLDLGRARRPAQRAVHVAPTAPSACPPVEIAGALLEQRPDPRLRRDRRRQAGPQPHRDRRRAGESRRDQREVRRLDLVRPGPGRHGWRAATTTCSTASCCAPTTARTCSCPG